MNTENYFKKYGYIYGVSSKFSFGTWSHNVKKFTNYEKAVNWLHTEEYDFRERVLTSKSNAIQLAGKDAVNNADCPKRHF